MSFIDLSNLGQISEPVKVFIEKVSDAVGGTFRPWQIRRVAEAEADAKEISAMADIRITSRQKRAAQRWLAEEDQKQANMEAITAAAVPQIKANAQPEKIERDWLVNFFDRARLTSDEGMQQLWAKILAGEANAPGKFSKRTINLVATLEKSDAELFQTLCRFMWHEPVGHRPIITSYQDPVYFAHGLNFDAFKHLDEIGLLTFNVAGFSYGFHGITATLKLPCTYFGTGFLAEISPARTQIEMGQVMLSRAGIDLSEVCGAEEVPGFADHVAGWWRSRGYKVEPREGGVT